MYCRDNAVPGAQPCTRPKGLLETRSPSKPATPTAPTEALSNQQQDSSAALADSDRSFTVGDPSGAGCLELVAQRIVIAPLETALLALALTCFDQVL